MFDEGHCILQWGDTFQPEYGLVERLRWFLPDVPFLVSSATIQLLNVSKLKDKLTMQKNFTFFHQSNDCPNVFYVVCSMKYPWKSFEDLAFLILKGWQPGDPLPLKFLVFFDNKKEAESAAQFLGNRLSLELRERLPWFHAGMTSFFRVEQVASFKDGETWGLFATDSGGMVWYLISFINIDSKRHIGIGYTRYTPCSAMEASSAARDSTPALWETGPRWKRCSSNFDC